MFNNHTEERVEDLETTGLCPYEGGITTPDPRPWVSSDPIFSAETRRLLNVAFKCYVRQFIIFSGIFGNIVSCVVFLKQGLSDRINLLLFWLAVADLVHLMANVLAVCYCYFSDSVLAKNWSTVYNAKMNQVLSWFNVSSGALMMVMSVDRCLFVVMPIKARRLLTYRPMVTAILLSYLIPFAFYFTIFLGNTVKWRLDPSTKRSIAYETDTPWLSSETRIRSLTNFRLITKSIFLAVITVCNVITIGYLRKAALNRSQMMKSIKEKDDTGDNKTTKMLLFLCVLCAMFLALEMSCSLSHTLFPEFNLYRTYHNSVVVVYQVLVFPTLCVNSAVNFFAYIVLSAKFRKSFQELFKCVCTQRRNQHDQVKRK